jgi:hypothetical protein
MPVIREDLTRENGDTVTVYIEVDERTLPVVEEDNARTFNPYPATRGVSQQIETAFGGAMELIRACAERTAQTISGIAPHLRPRACEVQFGVKVDAELGAVIGKTSTEAQIQVTLKWGEDKD